MSLRTRQVGGLKVKYDPKSCKEGTGFIVVSQPETTLHKVPCGSKSYGEALAEAIRWAEQNQDKAH